MNLDFFIKKNHIFKKRIIRPNYRDFFQITKHGSNDGLFVMKRVKFELVYLRVIKRLFKKRRFRKLNKQFYKSKYWTFITPNFIYSIKAKNSRMGAGVGSFVRVLQFIKPGKALIVFYLYAVKFLIKARNYIKFKLKIFLFLKLKRDDLLK